MNILLIDYQPEWPAMYLHEERNLSRALAGIGATIEHVGSTSVPGLAAKPIIDIMAGLEDFSAADSLVPKIVGLGYEYISRYEDTMPYRRYFVRRVDGAIEGRATHHLHIVFRGGTFWNRHLLFRNYLRTHPDARDDYAAMKRSLAERDWRDGNEYADAKTEFIREIERLAGAASGEIEERD